MKKLVFLLSFFMGVVVFSQSVQFANLNVKENNRGYVIAIKYNGEFLLNKNEVSLFMELLKNKLKIEKNIDVNYIKSEIIKYDENLYNLKLTSDNGYVTKTYLKISEDKTFLFRAPDSGISCTTTACAQTSGCIAALTMCTECTGDCTKTTTN